DAVFVAFADGLADHGNHAVHRDPTGFDQVIGIAARARAGIRDEAVEADRSRLVWSCRHLDGLPQQWLRLRMAAFPEPWRALPPAAHQGWVRVRRSSGTGRWWSWGTGS